MEVHNELGNGFLEPVYQEALEEEFKIQGIPYVREKLVPIMYKTICCVFNLQKRGFSCKISKINLISSITKMQKGDTTWKV